MKKILSMLMIALMMFANSVSAYAVSETVTITITINHTPDILVDGSADLEVSPSGTGVSGPITVKNIGTGATLTVTLAETAPNGWTAYYQFAAAKPAIDDVNWKAAGDISELLAHDATKSLYLKLVAPAPPISDTSVNISLTINANT